MKHESQPPSKYTQPKEKPPISTEIPRNIAWIETRPKLADILHKNMLTMYVQLFQKSNEAKTLLGMLLDIQSDRELNEGDNSLILDLERYARWSLNISPQLQSNNFGSLIQLLSQKDQPFFLGTHNLMRNMKPKLKADQPIRKDIKYCDLVLCYLYALNDGHVQQFIQPTDSTFDNTGILYYVDQQDRQAMGG